MVKDIGLRWCGGRERRKKKIFQLAIKVNVDQVGILGMDGTKNITTCKSAVEQALFYCRFRTLFLFIFNLSFEFFLSDYYL